MVWQFPGPGEEGLTWLKEHSATVKEGMAKIWFGPLVPSVSLFHPDTVKTILKTSARSVQFVRADCIYDVLVPRNRRRGTDVPEGKGIDGKRRHA